MKKLLIMGLILALCVLSVPVAADISGISPDNGPTDGGTAVTISSNGDFLSANEPYEAHFDIDASPPCTRLDDSTLTCTTPQHAVGTVPVTVWYFFGLFPVPGQTSFTYVDVTAPTITGISPDSGTYLGGTSVTISGTNLGSATEVKFGISPASIASNTATSIVVTTPPGTGPQDVVVTNGDGKTVTAKGAYTYTSWAVTGVSPTSGPTTGGTPVTISGEGFLSGDGPYRAAFDAILDTCTFVNSNQLTCTTPGPHVAGTVNVYVYNGAGFSQGPFSFTYVEGGSPVPEFPSAFLPATMIIGFLGAVLLIQRTREH